VKVVSNILGSLGMKQAVLEAGNGSLAAWNALQSQQAAQQLQDMMNNAMHHGNAQQGGIGQYPTSQGGWAATNEPDPVHNAVVELTRNPFQAASLYIRLRMTKAALKAKDIEIAFVRQMGNAVHVAIVTHDQVVTMIDEDVGAFPSDAFIARIRLLL
jgi:hypothetical protein